MTITSRSGLTAFYDTHPINQDEIIAKAVAAGASPETLSQNDLEPFDQDHYGGTDALRVLADLARIAGGHHVLDVCSGIGGPARWLASSRGARVTGIDLTASRVAGARHLTARVGLEHLVDFVQGDATDMPFEPAGFDAVISQESWLHIPDKAAVVAECARVVKPHGYIAFTDVTAGTALDEAAERRLSAEIMTSNLATAGDYVRLLEDSGCELVSCEDLSDAWKAVLAERLEMYRSLRDTTVAQFGQAHFEHYDAAYAHFVSCFATDKIGGVRIVARKTS